MKGKAHSSIVREWTSAGHVTNNCLLQALEDLIVSFLRSREKNRRYVNC